MLHLVLSQSASRGDRRERRTAQDTAARHFAKLAPQRIAHLRRSSDESSERGLLGIREGVGLIEREVHLRIADRDDLLDQMIARQQLDCECRERRIGGQREVGELLLNARFVELGNPDDIACLRRDRFAVDRIEVRDRRRAGDENIAAGRAVGLHHLRI